MQSRGSSLNKIYLEGNSCFWRGLNRVNPIDYKLYPEAYTAWFQGYDDHPEEETCD